MGNIKIFLLVMLVMLGGVPGTATAGKQVVCASVGEWPPMEYLNEDGRLAGYMVDLMEAAARIAGFTIEFRIVAEKDIVARLRDGEYDAICSSMLNDALRREELDFTTPYFLSRQVLVINGKRKIIASTDWSDLRFGARKGTFGMEAVRAMEGLSTEYDTISGAMDDVYVQNLDGLVCDEPVARYYAQVKYKKELTLSGYLAHSSKKPVSIAVAKGNREILQLLNKGISAVMLRGIDQELQRKWFSR